MVRAILYDWYPDPDASAVYIDEENYNNFNEVSLGKKVITVYNFLYVVRIHIIFCHKY